MEDQVNSMSSLLKEEGQNIDNVQPKEQNLALGVELTPKSDEVEKEERIQIDKRGEQFRTNSKLEEDSIILDQSNTLEGIFSSIEEGFPKEKPSERFIFPHPKYWLGSRYLAIWVLPLFLIKNLRTFLQELYKISTPYQPSVFSINKAETIYTSTKKVLKGDESMRFFGARFLAIWVLPLGATDIFIQYLLVNPLIN